MGNNRNLSQAIRLVLALSAASAAGVGVANAQTATAGESAGTPEVALTEVVVTGTRIQRPDYEAAAPVVSVTSQFIAQSGAVSLADTLNALPQLTPDLTSTSNNPGSTGQANLNLRGLGATRTLVLIDGRRAMPQDSSGVVDLNTIPAALIDRIEILTGGASTAYGSDAVAGVVNVIMKKNFEGVQVDVGYGWDAEHADGKTRSAALTLGGNFADGRGNNVVSIAVDNRDSVFQGARRFSANTLGPSLSTSGSSTLPGGRERNWIGNDQTIGSNRPSQAAYDAVFGSYGFPAGTCANTAAVGFNANGSLFCRGSSPNAGANLQPGQGGVVVGGGNVSYNFGAVNYLQLPETRKQILQAAHFDVTDNIQVYDQAYFTSYRAVAALAPTPLAGYSQIINGAVVTNEFTVPATNPTIPADLAALLAARPNPGADFAIGRRTVELGLRTQINDNDVYQILAGVKGDFDFIGHKLSWNVFGSYGHGNQPTSITGDVSIAAFQGILNGTTTVGSCNQANFNIFGAGSISPACQAAFGETNLFQQTTQQFNYEGTVQADLFNLMSSTPVTVLVGADYRKNTFDFLPDYPSLTGDADGINSGPVPPVSGQNIVKEYFMELSLPIVADLPGIKRLDADLSVRHSDYVIGGGVNTFGGTLDYKPINELSVRTSYARAVRAPTLADLFSPPSSGSPAYSDPCDTSNGPVTGAVEALCEKQGVPPGGGYTAPNAQVQATLSGNQNVKPETSDSFTFGVVWQSTFGGTQQLKSSADFWHYQVKNQIGTVGANTTLGLCFNENNANPTYDPANIHCQQVQRNASGDVQNILDPTVNLGDLKTAGVDFEVDYGLPVSTFGLPDTFGKLSLSLLMTLTMESEFQQLAGGAFVNTKGTITDISFSALQGAEPKWKGIGQLTYSIADVGVAWQTRYIDHMKALNDDGTAVEFGVQPFTPNYFIHRLTVSYTPAHFSLIGGVENVFNKQPPIYTTDTQAGIQANTDPSSFDVLGRRWFVNASYKF